MAALLTSQRLQISSVGVLVIATLNLLVEATQLYSMRLGYFTGSNFLDLGAYISAILMVCVLWCDGWLGKGLDCGADWGRTETGQGGWAGWLCGQVFDMRPHGSWMRRLICSHRCPSPSPTTSTSWQTDGTLLGKKGASRIGPRPRSKFHSSLPACSQLWSWFPLAFACMLTACTQVCGGDSRLSGLDELADLHPALWLHRHLCPDDDLHPRHSQQGASQHSMPQTHSAKTLVVLQDSLLAACL